MIQNKLQLSQNKTETLVVQSRNIFESWSVDRMSLSESESITPSAVAVVKRIKVLEYLFYEYLTFESHISSVIPVYRAAISS